MMYAWHSRFIRTQAWKVPIVLAAGLESSLQNMWWFIHTRPCHLRPTTRTHALQMLLHSPVDCVTDIEVVMLTLV